MNKPTSGTVSVSRELLERAVKAGGAGCSGAELVDAWAAVGELRAILAQPAKQQQEPVAWRYQSHAGGLWYLSSSEHNARTFQCNGEGGEVEPLYRHPPAQQRTEEQERAESNFSKKGCKNVEGKNTSFHVAYGCVPVVVDCTAIDRLNIRPLKMPDRKQHTSLGLTSLDSEADGWNACLDEVARLNGEQP